MRSFSEGSFTSALLPSVSVPLISLTLIRTCVYVPFSTSNSSSRVALSLLRRVRSTVRSSMSKRCTPLSSISSSVAPALVVAVLSVGVDPSSSSSSLPALRNSTWETVTFRCSKSSMAPGWSLM
jgi:hypothetical protein